MGVKQIKLDIHNGLNRIVDVGGKGPTITQNTGVQVSHNGFIIELKLQTLLIPPTDKYVGIVTSLPADKEKYEGLTIGDEIFFKKENIRSIF